MSLCKLDLLLPVDLDVNYERGFLLAIQMSPGKHHLRAMRALHLLVYTIKRFTRSISAPITFTSSSLVSIWPGNLVHEIQLYSIHTESMQVVSLTAKYLHEKMKGFAQWPSDPAVVSMKFTYHKI